MHELAPREDQGVVFGIVQASPNSSLDQTTLYSTQLGDVFKTFPEFDTSFQITQPGGGFSGMVVKPWGERTRTTEEISHEAYGKAAQVPGIRAIVTTPPPLPGGSDFPIDLVISTTSEPRDLVPFAEQLVGTAFASGKFMFADADLKFDLPQSEIVLDRDKVASMGLDLRQIGGDLSAMLSGNYVNRFTIQGRSYKVIPQLKRRERMTPEQLTSVYVSGPEDSLIRLSTIASVEDSVQPRQLNRFQQLNSVKIQGVQVPGTSIDAALKVLEDAAEKMLPAGYRIDYAGESRQLRT